MKLIKYKKKKARVPSGYFPTALPPFVDEDCVTGTCRHLDHVTKFPIMSGKVRIIRTCDARDRLESSPWSSEDRYIKSDRGTVRAHLEDEEGRIYKISDVQLWEILYHLSVTRNLRIDSKGWIDGGWTYSKQGPDMLLHPNYEMG